MYVCILSQERVKLRTSKYYIHIHTIDRNKSPLTISGKVGVGIMQGIAKIFRAPIYIYRAHRAVIFAIAQLSCFDSSCYISNIVSTFLYPFSGLQTVYETMAIRSISISSLAYGSSWVDERNEIIRHMHTRGSTWLIEDRILGSDAERMLWCIGEFDCTPSLDIMVPTAKSYAKCTH